MTVETDTKSVETSSTSAAPPVAPVATRVTTADLPPEALAKRLEQAEHAAQTKLLKSLGITDVEEARTALAAHAAQKDAAKTIEQKLAALELQAKASAEALSLAVEQTAKKITPEQKAAIDALAGEDKASWMKLYAAMSPTWAAPAPAATTTTTTALATSPAPTVPASSAPTAPAPAPTGKTSPPDHAARYKQLQNTNPFAAAAYLERHSAAIFK